MFATTIQIQALLQVIRGKILQLPIKRFFKNLLLEDIDLAIASFNQGNVLTALNSISVIVDKLHTKLETCNLDGISVQPLLADIHHLQQILIEIPTSGGNIPFPPACPLTGNLVINGDFENATTFNTDWSPTGGATSDNTANDLDNNLRIARLPAGATISQEIPGIQPNCPYLLSFMVKTQNIGSPGRVDVFFRDSNNMIIGTVTNLVRSHAQSYATFVYKLVAPPGTDNVLLQFTNIDTSNVMNLDLVVFSAG